MLVLAVLLAQGAHLLELLLAQLFLKRSSPSNTAASAYSIQVQMAAPLPAAFRGPKRGGREFVSKLY